jgi:hypothetical protein
MTKQLYILSLSDAQEDPQVIPFWWDETGNWVDVVRKVIQERGRLVLESGEWGTILYHGTIEENIELFNIGIAPWPLEEVLQVVGEETPSVKVERILTPADREMHIRWCRQNDAVSSSGLVQAEGYYEKLGDLAAIHGNTEHNPATGFACFKPDTPDWIRTLAAETYGWNFLLDVGQSASNRC